MYEQKSFRNGVLLVYHVTAQNIATPLLAQLAEKPIPRPGWLMLLFATPYFACRLPTGLVWNGQFLRSILTVGSLI